MDVASGTLSRRQLFGVAAVGAAGVAGLPIAGYEVWSHMQRPATATASAPWPSPLGAPRARAAHLLRRAGFGATSAALDSAAAMPYAELVEQVVNQSPQPMPPPADPTANAETVAASDPAHQPRHFLHE